MTTLINKVRSSLEGDKIQNLVEDTFHLTIFVSAVAIMCLSIAQM